MLGSGAAFARSRTLCYNPRAMSGPPRRPPLGRASDSFSARLLPSGDRSVTAPMIGVVLAAMIVILWVLFLPPFALVRGDSRQTVGDGYTVEVANSVPALPQGLAPASKYYTQISSRKNSRGAVSISLPLLDPKASSRGLSFYTFQAGNWQRLAGADVTPDASLGQGQLQNLPDNLILLKRQGGALQVMGTLPAGKSLSPSAAGQITVLNPAGYTPRPDGSLTGEAPPAIPGAQYDVIPAVQAPNGDAARAVDAILASPEQRQAHLGALATLANQPGNTGVELDYTAVTPQGRQAFTDLVSALAQELHKNHRTLGVALPAPSLSGSGWNTGSYDWTSLAKSADYLKLVPALDESVYRKQMPDLLKYLTGQAGVDAHKIVLVTSPNSVEKSDTQTQPITRLNALSIASQIQVRNPDQAVTGSTVTFVAPNLDHDAGGSGLVWDGTTATVSFVFKVGDATHVVWIENQFSEAFKLEYVEIYHLGGIAVDDASNDPSLGDVWPAISQFVATGAPLLQQPNPALLAPTWLVDTKPVSSDSKTVLSWSAPSQPGQHSVSLIVGDGVIRVLDSTQVMVRTSAAAGSTAVSGFGTSATATPRPAPLTATPTLRSPSVTPSPTAVR